MQRAHRTYHDVNLIGPQPLSAAADLTAIPAVLHVRRVGNLGTQAATEFVLKTQHLQHLQQVISSENKEKQNMITHYQRTHNNINQRLVKEKQQEITFLQASYLCLRYHCVFK